MWGAFVFKEFCELGLRMRISPVRSCTRELQRLVLVQLDTVSGCIQDRKARSRLRVTELHSALVNLRGLLRGFHDAAIAYKVR